MYAARITPENTVYEASHFYDSAIVFVNYVVVHVWLFPDGLRRASNNKVDAEYGVDCARVVRVVDKESVIVWFWCGISIVCVSLSSYLLGLLAKIKCSISSSQPDL